MVDPEIIEKSLNHTIEVTYDAFDGCDFYKVLKVDENNEVVLQRTGHGNEPFTVSKSWFTRHDTGRNIRILT
jgi:hypothetical protein